MRWLALAGVVVFVALFVVDQLNQRESERLERLQDDRTVEALLAGGFSASDEAWQLATRAHGGRPGWRAAAILADQSASTEVRLMAGFMLVQAGNATPAEKAEVFAMTRRAPPSLRAAGFRALKGQRGNDLNGDINLLFFQGACDPDPEVSAVSRDIVGPHPYSCGPQKP